MIRVHDASLAFILVFPDPRSSLLSGGLPAQLAIAGNHQDYAAVCLALRRFRLTLAADKMMCCFPSDGGAHALIAWARVFA